MPDFSYDKAELPEIVEGKSWVLDKKKYSAERVTYYDVGNWSMSDLPDEDGDVEYARKAALAWIAWFEYLANKEETNE